MSSISEIVAGLRNQVSGLRTRLLSVSANDILYSAVGEYVVYGCKVTEGDDATDMVVALEGAATGDEAHLNPDLAASPVRGFEYPNIASTKDGAFRSTDTTATVEDPPATGLGRYDIAYIYVGPGGAGVSVATGTPSEAAKTDFDTNGLDASAYGEATIEDPALPTGALPVARIYVEGDVTGIPNSRIADLRRFGIASLAEIADDIETVAGMGSNIADVSGIKDEIATVAEASEDVETVAGIAADVSSAAGISPAIQTVAANIADIQSAEGNADRAESARDIAVAAAGEITSTSTTPLAIATGTTTWITGTGLSWAAGMHIIAHDRADASNSMSGTITSYDDATGELVVDVDATSGSGTIADWVIVNQVRAANILQVSKHSRVGRRFQFDYLTGNTSSVDAVYAATQKEAVFQVGDTVEVSAYSPTSPKCPAVWECIAVDAELPAGAVAGDVTGAAEGRLYVANSGGGYLRFELVGDINLLAFGAAGDGVTDDSAAIQAAVDYSAHIGKSLLIPDGAYASQTITLRNRLHVQGEKGATISHYDNHAGALLEATSGLSDVIIDGVTLDDAFTTGPVLTMQGSMTNVTVSNCTFNNLVDGTSSINMSGPGILTDVGFYRNIFNGNPNATTRGNLMSIGQMANGFYIVGNRCLYTGSIIHTLSQGNDESVVGRNVVIDGNYFYKFHGPPYQTRANGPFLQRDFKITNNVMTGSFPVDATNGALIIGHTLAGRTGARWDGVSICGNIITGIGQESNTWGISVGGGAGTTEYVRNLIIQGNLIDLSDFDTGEPYYDGSGTGRGISLQINVVDGFDISGNTIRNTPDAGIFLYGAKNGVIRGNTLEHTMIRNSPDAAHPKAAISIDGASTRRILVAENSVHNAGGSTDVDISGVSFGGSAVAPEVDVTITNNVITDDREDSVMAYGILIGNQNYGGNNQYRGIVVRGNTCRGARIKEVRHLYSSGLAASSAGLEVGGNVMGFGVRALEDSATPDVNCEEVLSANPDDNQTITNLIGGVRGQKLTIYNVSADYTVTFVHGANISLKGGADRTISQGEAIQLMFIQIGSWVEV